MQATYPPPAGHLHRSLHKPFYTISTSALTLTLSLLSIRHSQPDLLLLLPFLLGNTLQESSPFCFTARKPPIQPSMASSSHGESSRKKVRRRSVEEPLALPAPKRPAEERLALPAPPVRRRYGYSEAEETPFELNILLPDGSNVVLREERDDELGVEELLRKIKRKVCKAGDREASSVKWGAHVYLEDAAGNRIQDGCIFDSDDANRILILQDGQPHGIHSLQDMWNVTPDPELLDSLPQEYTLETALADLLDNSLQAVWANLPGEKRLISVTLKQGKITIFDSGQGMDSTSENSIAKWGTMGSSKHRSLRVSAIGGKPPFLRPYFGMYGFGGLYAAMHLGGVAVVSSKTKSSKKVVTLTLEKDKLMERCKTDRTWKTPGEYREPTEEELRRSPHGSFTKVELSKLERKVWTENQVMCMLKDIYFPYIQCDAADSSQRTTTPVEFQVNDTNLTEVDGGEAAVTNMYSCNGSPFVIDIYLKKITQNTDPEFVNDLNRANARIKCFYFPIQQGKENIDHILEELQKKNFGINETFDNFCRVSIRRLGRLLPDARWRRLPFMEPRRKRGDKAGVPKICFERVKAFVDTDAGFVPTTSKMDLLTGHAFTSFLKNLGTRGNMPEVVAFELYRGTRHLKLQDVEREYEDWIREMHELFDEEVECVDEPDYIVTETLKELGFSQDVYRIYSKMNRKGVLWKQNMRIKFCKGLPWQKNKDFYATIEYFLADGLSEDRGNTKVICRPMEIPKVEGSRLINGHSGFGFELKKSKAVSIDFLTSDKCEILEERDWRRIYDNKHLHEPGEIDILDKKIIRCLGLNGGIASVVKAGVKPFDHIYAVVRPNIYLKLAQEGKEVNPIDQKNIVKKPMQMKLQLRRLNGLNPHTSESTDQDEFEMDFSILVSEKSINNIHGFYCFNTENGDFRRFYTKAGKYALTFSVVDEGNSDGLLEKTLEVNVSPSDKVGKWMLQSMDGPGTPIARLGSEIGPLLLHCLDEYDNVKNAEQPHDLRFEVWSGERRLELDLCVDRSSEQEKSKTSLIIKAIKLTGGLLRGIAVDYSALLKLVISNKPVASMEINVLPGEMNSIQVASIGEVDNCLRTGDIIHLLTLQVMDGYGNHVEKGRRVVLRLDNLELQDDQGHDRTVDDEGYIKLGGLLKVTGPFNSKASICVYSENKKLLYRKEFSLLKRALQIISNLPEDYAVGGLLHDLSVQIVDENGNVDETMTGSRHFIILTSAEQSVYPLKEGACCIKTIQLPDQPGLWHCWINHMMHQELEAQIQINLVVARQHSYDVMDSADNDKCPTFLLHDRAGLQKDLERLGEGLIARLKDLKKKMEIYSNKVQRGEAELDELDAMKKTEIDSISRLEGEIESLKIEAQSVEEGSVIDGRSEFTAEGIAQQISKTSFPAKFFLEAFCSGSFLSSEAGIPCDTNILGVVCLLASARDEALSQALAEFIGQPSMLAVVCKTQEAADLLVRLNENGNLDETWGLYKFIKSQNRNVNGKLRMFILEDLRCFNKGHDENHPQKLLNMEVPKLSNGMVPSGFIGYAVNLLHLNEEHLEVTITSGDDSGLRGSLFYSLLKELQVYDTQNNLFNARDALTTGGISLDGGLIRKRGCADFGKRENLKIVFPLHSKAGKKIPSLRSINQISKSMQIQDTMKGKKKEVQARRERVEELDEKMRYVKKIIKSREEKYKTTSDALEKDCQELEKIKYNMQNV